MMIFPGRQCFCYHLQRTSLCNKKIPRSTDFYFHVREKSPIPISLLGNQNPLYQLKLVFFSQGISIAPNNQKAGCTKNQNNFPLSIRERLVTQLHP